jgi:hypothetical protein
MKFERNIFKVNHIQKPKPHKNIHMSIQSIPRVIDVQTAKIEICEVLINTPSNSSLFSQFHDFSIKLLILESTIFVNARVITTTAMAKAKFINMSALKKFKIKFALSHAFSASFHHKA